MARLRRDCICRLIIFLALAWAALARAEEPAEAGPDGVYDRPTLVLDPGMHTAAIRRADVDAAGSHAVTGSEDKTVRIWSIADGKLERTIRVPAGPGNVGKIFAVAISPDGEIMAAGGFTAGAGQWQHIYLFERETGGMVGRIDGVEASVHHLAFSPDGRHLVATLYARGIRVYEREAGWAEVFRDTNYFDQSYGADFSTDGRLATTSDDGYVRLYSHNFRVLTYASTGGYRPYGIAFSPDGSKLAIGYDRTAAVSILDGHTLAPLTEPDTTGINNGDLSSVAWSADGTTLFAGGRHRLDNGTTAVVAWAEAGGGIRQELSASSDIILSLMPLVDGGLLVAAADPYLALLDPEGRERWVNRPAMADFHNQSNSLAVSADGQTVDFGYEEWGKARARFDLASLHLTFDPADDGRTTPPKHDGLPIEGWNHTTRPTLDGEPLALEPHERAFSFALDPSGGRFVLGAEWSLRAYDQNAESLWHREVPEVVSAVNISGDGRLVVAAHADGTIRWHRMDDGKELLALFPLADRTNWVAWTPDGFYASTPGAYRVLRWQVNHGWDAPAEAIPVSDIGKLRRPDVLRRVVETMDIVATVGVVGLDEARTASQKRLNSAIRPGTQLHVLAVGISKYNKQAQHLQLKFADKDAGDVFEILRDTQGGLYGKVNSQALRNAEATRAGIFFVLDELYNTMQQGDIAVFFFSGHGALVDGALFLLPYDVDPRFDASLKTSAIRIGELQEELIRLSKRGSVLVLLDACRSGAATEGYATQLRAALAAGNVTVLTSSSGNENSIENEKWQNGAFTEVFLQALGQGADSDRNGVISMAELTHFVIDAVPRLVREVDPERQQTPGIEMRFGHTIFAAGL